MNTVADLKPNPNNPRIVTENKEALLRAAMDEFGDISGIVFNRTTKQLMGGHQRIKQVPADAKVFIEKSYKNPSRTGTVAEGYILFNGEKFSYREVEWTEEKEMAANIAANKGAGEWDYATLGSWMVKLNDSQFDTTLTMFDSEEQKVFFDHTSWEASSEKVEKETPHVDGFRGTIKVKVPNEHKAKVLGLIQEAISKSPFVDVVEIVS